jgi:hypothetical protein
MGLVEESAAVGAGVVSGEVGVEVAAGCAATPGAAGALVWEYAGDARAKMPATRREN